MQGYILYQLPNGPVQREYADHSSRRVLTQTLEGLVPETGTVLAVVLGPRPSNHLRDVAA